MNDFETQDYVDENIKINSIRGTEKQTSLWSITQRSTKKSIKTQDLALYLEKLEIIEGKLNPQVLIQSFHKVGSLTFLL